MEAFADCLAHADDLAESEHDLATAFWEQDFAHIDYRVADPFLGGEVLPQGTIDALRETVLRRLTRRLLAAASVAGWRRAIFWWSSVRGSMSAAWL